MAGSANETGALNRVPLHESHVAAGARLTPFAGWEMPIQYEGIVAEHEAVRSRAGMFDVSHMGRAWVTGDAAAAQIRSVSTYNTALIGPGETHYSLYCNESGGIDDDVFIYHVTEGRWFIVHNAANAESDAERLGAATGSAMQEVTRETAMLAVQGPEAPGKVERLVAPGFTDLAARTCMEVEWRGAPLLVSRTGYTGEDGAEIVIPADRAAELWDTFAQDGVVPCGLGARETLRLEAALPLHGHDLSPETTPYQARLGWTVSLDDDTPFTGRRALEQLAQEKPAIRIAHLKLTERGIPRDGYPVVDADGNTIGTLTSGAYSPTLRTGIAMAYLPAEQTAIGTKLAVRVRDRNIAAEVVRRPFYRATHARDRRN